MHLHIAIAVFVTVLALGKIVPNAVKYHSAIIPITVVCMLSTHLLYAKMVSTLNIKASHLDLNIHKCTCSESG